MIDADAALTFLGFVQNRHRIWERRQAGLPQQTWTDDPILERKKFTNVFRILDPGTQFIMTDLIEPGLAPEDLLLRLFLYRHTGRVEAWKHLELTTGYPTRENLDDVAAVWKVYRGGGHTVDRGSNPSRNAAGATWTKFDRPVFTSAYLVFPQSTVPGTDKLDAIIDLTRRLFVDGRTGQLFLAAGSQQDRFAALRSNKGVADFMSMQILTDWGYTPFAGGDYENDFVVAGPGAVRGAAAIDPASKPLDVIRWAAKSLAYAGGPLLGTRLPSYMDVQNCLCEFSKYVRYESKPVTGKPYRAAHPGPQQPPVLPQHW